VTDVLLINPPIYLDDEGAGGTHPSDPLSYDQPPIHFPPIGLAYLGAALEADGFGVTILDAWAQPDPARLILDAVRRHPPRVVGLSVLVFTLPSVYRLVPQIRAAAPRAAIVLGNMQVAQDPELVAKMGADFGVLGWGEAPLVALTRQLVRGEGADEDIPGLVRPDGDGVRVTPPTCPRDIDELPPPARHLLGARRYYSPADARPMTMIATQRGCPFRCGHCHHASPDVRAAFPLRVRDVDAVVDELRLIRANTDIRYAEFTDDTFTSNRKRALAFCAALQRASVGMEWGCDSRANLLDVELLTAMNGAGCKKLSVGVETASEAIRFGMNKQIRNEEIRATFRACRQVGIETTANFMFGLPGETLDDLERTVRFAIDLRPTYVEFHIALVLPGTPLYHDAVARGVIPADVFDRFMRGEAPFPVFVPEGLDAGDLQRKDLDAYRRFYLRPGYVFERVKRLTGPADLLRHIRMALWIVMSTRSR
jgi:anaerobic magnesium-protoporphyrin IX monomethyl ester cyclase